MPTVNYSQDFDPIAGRQGKGLLDRAMSCKEVQFPGAGVRQRKLLSDINWGSTVIESDEDDFLRHGLGTQAMMGW